MTIKNWQIRGTDEKTEMNLRKTEIQQKFKSELALIVDNPKPVFGSTNDGNTARKFFKNAVITS